MHPAKTSVPLPTLSPPQIEALILPLVPGLKPAAAPQLYQQLSLLLDLLLRWNARTNLTAIRDPVQIVQRHFAESLFAARFLPRTGTLLDLGSGAGFPGIPIQLLRPNLTVTLAESQGKKSSFLREAIRILDLPTTIWSARAETLPPTARYDIVTLRAVDSMPQALQCAAKLSASTLLILASSGTVPQVLASAPLFSFVQYPVPLSTSRLVLIGSCG